jgi:hypothetical protein
VIRRIWTGHRIVAIAVSVFAIVAIMAAGVLTMVVAGGAAHATPTPTATPTAIVTPFPTPTATPTPEPTALILDTPEPSPTSMPVGWAYSDLDGVAAPAAQAHGLPLAIMIDDNTVARPQSGISSASIVYQAYADGGEDRYMFVFQEGTATDVGPVRSARPYYVYWADEYKALFGHFGGDANTLTRIIPANAKYIYNMDDLSGGSCPYHRIATRAAPHNAYTNTPILITCAGKKGYPATFQKLPTRPFKDDMSIVDRPNSQVINVPYRTGTIGYQYNFMTDNYTRLQDGQPEIDPANGNNVYARSIVVLYQGVTTDPLSEPGHNRPWVQNVGSGPATVFMEGHAIDATWKKTSNTALTRLYDKSGAEIPFVRGEIFIQSVPPGTAVTVK